MDEYTIMYNWISNLKFNTQVAIQSDKAHDLIVKILEKGLFPNCELCNNGNYIQKIDLDFSLENSTPYKLGWHDKKYRKNKK